MKTSSTGTPKGWGGARPLCPSGSRLGSGVGSEAPGAALFPGVKMTTASWGQKALLLRVGVDGAEEGAFPWTGWGQGQCLGEQCCPWVLWIPIHLLVDQQAGWASSRK